MSEPPDLDLDMADGSARVQMAPHTLYTIDPHSRLLRVEPRFETWQEWTAEQAKAKVKASQ